MQIYGYRVLENDDEGDPIDHGVVSATDAGHAEDIVRTHLTLLGNEDTTLVVRFYPLKSRKSAGIWADADNFFDATIVTGVAE